MVAKDDTLRGVLWVIGGLIMHLYLGWFYLWGNIQVYVASYFNKIDGPVSLDDTSIIFVIQTISQAVFMPMSPFLLRYLKPWQLCLIGGFIAIGGVFLSTFAKSFVLFSVTYPVFYGMGIGFSYMAPIIWGWEYFPNKRGLVSGLIVLGFGFGSFIFGFISLAVANPDNVSANFKVDGGRIFPPDSPISSHAPKMMRINWAIWVGLLLIALPLIRRKVKPNIPVAILDSHGDNPYDSKGEELFTNIDHERESIKIIEPTLSEAFYDFRTLQIFIMIILSSSYPYYISSNFKSYEQKDIHDDKFITMVGSIGAVFNGLSRGFWASLQDYLGFKVVYMWILFIEMIIAFTIISIHKIKALYLIWVWLSFAWLGGHFSIYPTLCAKIYGPSMGGKMYSIFFAGFSTATLLNWILSKESSKVIYILASMSVLAFIFALFLNVSSKVKTKSQSFLGDKISEISD